MSDKWIMFKNYLHNELKITKDDIRVWLEEAAKEEAARLIQNSYSSFEPREIIKDLLTESDYLWSDNKSFKNDIKVLCAEELMKKFEIKEKTS